MTQKPPILWSHGWLGLNTLPHVAHSEGTTTPVPQHVVAMRSRDTHPPDVGLEAFTKSYTQI